jgi:hypothetical protein
MIAMMRGRDRVRWAVTGPVVGMALGAVDSVVNHVPIWLGEVGVARAGRSGWAQAAEFASLILDAGWAWAAVAVLAGWLVSRHVGFGLGTFRGVVAGGLALVFATAAYYGMDVIFDGGGWWGTATLYWLIGSVVFGPVLGAVGALIRRLSWVGTLAGLMVPLGAASQMVLLPPPSESLMAKPVRLIVWVAAAVATVLVVRRNGLSPSPSGFGEAEAS